MMSLLIPLFIRNREDVLNPSVKKAYAALSSMVGIMLNLFLCTAKIIIGLLSHSVAISVDGFNNLADAGTNLVSLLGFKIAKYGRGSIHPFGHGRIEWIMGKAADEDILETILQMAGEFSEITAVQNLMIHDYGFGYFVVSMRAEGYKKDSEKLYAAANEIGYNLYQKFHCDCFIQIDYLLGDETVMDFITEKIESANPKYRAIIRGIMRRERFSLCR